MPEFIQVVSLLLFWLFVGIGLFKVVEIGTASGKAALTTRARVAVVIFGWILLLAGMIIFLAEIADVALSALEGDIYVSIVEYTVALLSKTLLTSLIPIAGALLISVGRMLRRDRESEEMAKFCWRLEGLRIIAWCWVAPAILLACALTLWGFPLLLLVLIVFIIRMRRASRQDSLVWVLAIGAQKGLSLADTVSEYADHCSGGYRSRIQQLSQRLSAGMPLPEALAVDPQLIPAQAHVAVRVGYEAGVLSESLREFAVSRSYRRPVWQSALGRLYLILLPIFALQAIGGFVWYFITPKFKMIFYAFGVELPKAMYLVENIGDKFVTGFLLPLFVVVKLALVLYLIGCLLGGGRVTSFFSINMVFSAVDRAAIARALAVCVDAAHPLQAGLRTLADCFPKLRARAQLERASILCTGGTNWEESLRAAGLVRVREAVLLESAQRVGNLAWALRTMADRAELRFVYSLQLLTQLLFPFVVIALGGAVFLFAVAYFSPLIKLISELSG